LFSNLSLIYSDYDYKLDFSFADFEWNSSIVNFNLKYDFKYYLTEKLKLEYGLKSIYYKFDPGLIEPTTENSQIQTNKLTDKYALESALYAGINYQISPKISLQVGSRLSNFIRFGQKLNSYNDNNPLIYNPSLKLYQGAEPTGQVDYDQADVLKDFTYFEPRVALAYQNKFNQ
jgi:hypothetical protein